MTDKKQYVMTPTVVTQADVDREWAKQHGGGDAK